MKKSFVFFGNMYACLLILLGVFLWSNRVFATLAPVDSIPILVDEPILSPASSVSVVGTTGASPVGIVLDPIGNIYTVNIGDDTITKITPAGVSSVFATVDSTPAEIVRDTLGNLYTANSSANNVSKITPAGVVTTLGTTGMQPVALVVDPVGNVYTANKESNTVTKITPSGVSTILGTTGGEPSEIVINNSGVIFTLDRQTHTITRITPSGISNTYFNFTPHFIEGLTIDTKGRLFFTDVTWGAVFKLNSFVNFIGNVVGSWVWIGNTGFVNPSPIVLAPNGIIYTGNLGDSTITKMDQDGNAITYATVAPFPDDMALDNLGNLYVVNSDFDTVTKITP